ncbi:MAG: UDP-N-acetylmuramate dehydrogenase [Chitinophagaceae bacterium]
MNLKQNIPLKPYNTFGINVLAKYFATFSNTNELAELVNYGTNNKMVSLIMGGGSNILFTQNFDGIVLKNDISGIELINEDENNYYVKAAAGVIWHQFILHCIKNNYAGAENLSLIPGTVGAAPLQNIGAYGVELKDIFFELEAMNIADYKIEKFGLNDCAFGYRESVFKRKLKGHYIITSVTFKLNKQPSFNTRYGAIEQELEKMGCKELSIKNISDAVINIRSSKLPNPKEIGNAGSFFKNPVVDETLYQQLIAKYPTMPVYPANNNQYKLAAGWLIEQCGWKGFRKNDAGCHAKQALVLVNYGNATGSEIYSLSSEIIESVYNKFKVHLEREVNII